MGVIGKPKGQKQRCPLAVRIPAREQIQLHELAKVRNINRNKLIVKILRQELEAAKASHEITEMDV